MGRRPPRRGQGYQPAQARSRERRGWNTGPFDTFGLFPRQRRTGPRHEHHHHPRLRPRHRRRAGDRVRGRVARDRAGRPHHRGRQRRARQDHRERPRGGVVRRPRRRCRSPPGAARRCCARRCTPGTCTARAASAARCCRRPRRAAEAGHAIDYIIEAAAAAPGRDHAGRDRPADQHRAGAAARAPAGVVGQGLRDHGRLGVARQRDPRRRVQHLGRPRGGGDRVRRGVAVRRADDRARRHAAGAGDRRRPGPDADARRARLAAAAAGPRAVPRLGRHRPASRRCTTCARSSPSPTPRSSSYTPALVQVETHGALTVGHDRHRLLKIDHPERAGGHRDRGRSLLGRHPRRLHGRSPRGWGRPAPPARVGHRRDHLRRP